MADFFRVEPKLEPNFFLGLGLLSSFSLRRGIHTPMLVNSGGIH